MSDEVQFGRGGARRPAPRVDDPVLQWSIGLFTTDRRVYAGWLAPVDRDPAFDDAMEQAGYEQVMIRHGSGNVVTHWAVEVADLFIITDGLQTMAEMQQTRERVGIAFGWRTLPSGRQQSQLRLRAFLRDLLAVGYHHPVLVTVKGTLTTDVLTALLRQFDVLDTLDAIRAESGKPPLGPPFYACSIPLGPGESVLRGSTQKTRDVAPIVAQVPATVDREYIAQHWIKRDWVPLIEGLVDATVRWSQAESARIVEGSDLATLGDATDEEVADAT